MSAATGGRLPTFVVGDRMTVSREKTVVGGNTSALGGRQTMGLDYSGIGTNGVLIQNLNNSNHSGKDDSMI